jgi:hypothetical protein
MHWAYHGKHILINILYSAIACIVSYPYLRTQKFRSPSIVVGKLACMQPRHCVWPAFLITKHPTALQGNFGGYEVPNEEKIRNMIAKRRYFCVIEAAFLAYEAL